VLQIDDLRFAYPGSGDVISGVTLSLAKGARLAVVGENGSGKTTLARLVCGLLEPTGGTVRVDGLDTRDAASIYEVRRRVGLVFQDPDDQMVETTVEREVAFGPLNLGLSLDEVDERVRDSLAAFRIERLAKRPCHLLSAGEKQLVAVASVFAMRPEYLVLDESTSLLDRAARLDLLAAVERLLGDTGAGLLLISMRLEDIWACDQAVLLKGGAVSFRGTRDEFLRHLKSLGFPLSGLGLLAGTLDDAVPGFLAELARGRSLAGQSVAEALLTLTARSSGDGGNPGPGGSLDASGGAPCP